MKERARIINWQKVHVRLEQARLAMESGGTPTPAEIARILRDRAVTLAAPLERTQPATEMMELLVFSLAGERFGIETTHLLEATPLRDLLPVPCTPAFVLGVVNYRGLILTVMDLRQLLNLPAESTPTGRRVIWAEAGGVTLGLAVDAVAGTFSVPVLQVASPPEALTGLRLALTSGITEDLITVLDLDALTRAPELAIDEEVA